MHDLILEQTLQIVDSFLVRVLRNSRDWITVTFNPQWAQATPLGKVTRRGEKPSFPLPPIGETATNWIPCSVTRENGMYVGSRKLSGGKRVGAIYDWRTCVRDGGGSLCRRTARAIRQNLLPRTDRACTITREAGLVSREFPAYVTFTGISSSPSFFRLVSPKRARRKRVRVRRSRSIRERGVSLRRAFAPR